MSRNNVFSTLLRGRIICVFNALGCYLSIYSKHLEDTEKFLIHPGSQFCTVTQTFSLQIGKVSKRYYDRVRNSVLFSHFNIQGIRKHSCCLYYHTRPSLYFNCLKVSLSRKNVFSNPFKGQEYLCAYCFKLLLVYLFQTVQG